jgi:hypothetical protein
MMSKMNRLLAAISCAALMGGAVLYACDFETPKSATNPCHSLGVCSSNIPYQNSDGVWVCNSARTSPKYYHTECKSAGYSEVNCNGAPAPCHRFVSCKVILQPTGTRVCVDNQVSGDWSNTTKKVEEGCY